MDLPFLIASMNTTIFHELEETVESALLI